MRLKRTEIAALVVVVVFAALLFGFSVYPALNEGPKRLCFAHLDKVSIALSMYVGETGGLFPPGPVWADALLVRDLDSREALVCPQANVTDEQEQRLQREGTAGLPIGYSLYEPLSAKPARGLTDPVKTPVIFDSNEIGANSVADIGALALRHAGKTANVTYADGHAEAVKSVPQVPQPLYKPKEDAGKKPPVAPPPPPSA
jgi:prepilin-type processing-associated H-X9-DG protein